VILRFGRFTLDAAQRLLLRDGASVHLTPKAYVLLLLLASEAPRVVLKSEIHDRLWPGTYVSDATLVGLIKELRRALDDTDPASPVIRTAHRVGYAFCQPFELPLPARQDAAWHWLVLRGRRVALHEGENAIGRDPKADVRIDAASVSRRHARIVIDRAGGRLEDVGSKNGTTVGEACVSNPVTLHDGDRIAFGSVVSVYRTSIAGMSTETRSRSPVRSSTARVDP